MQGLISFKQHRIFYIAGYNRLFLSHTIIRVKVQDPLRPIREIDVSFSHHVGLHKKVFQ